MEFKGSAKVHEEKGKKVAKFSIPTSFQGHTFAVDFSINGDEQQISDDYRIEYILGNSFANDQISLKENELHEGFSNLILAGKMKEIEHISCYYAPQNDKTQKRTAKLYFKYRDTTYQLQRIVVEIKEDTVDNALKFSSAFVQQFLDILTYKKGVPLEVRKIEIFDRVSGNPLRNYVQIPYTSIVEVLPQDLEAAPHIPDRIKPLLRIFREAVNSNNVFYRFLCLFRLFEGLQKIRANNNVEAKSKGVPLTRDRIQVPDNELTRHGFPGLISKPFNDFVDYVREKYRLNIAHLNIDDYERLLLDPGMVGNTHSIDQANAVLIELSRQAIQAEWKFMQANGIGINEGVET
ncbi:MAG: hypothetical protein JRJ50_12500 [Deltaproteobacteria bacterium]|nr:hypothetical protein [Deltaproteobacteria bacterium]MBW2115685.1 hypothetical protein [Deltaproteobacteria bacterium]